MQEIESNEDGTNNRKQLFVLRRVLLGQTLLVFLFLIGGCFFSLFFSVDATILLSTDRIIYSSPPC